MDRHIDRLRDSFQCHDRVYGRTAESSIARTSPPPRYHSRASHRTADRNRHTDESRARLSNDQHERVKDVRRRSSPPRRSRKDLSRRVSRRDELGPVSLTTRAAPLADFQILTADVGTDMSSTSIAGLCHKWLRPAAGKTPDRALLGACERTSKTYRRESRREKCPFFVHSEILTARQVPI